MLYCVDNDRGVTVLIGFPVYVTRINMFNALKGSDLS